LKIENGETGSFTGKLKVESGKLKVGNRGASLDNWKWKIENWKWGNGELHHEDIEVNEGLTIEN